MKTVFKKMKTVFKVIQTNTQLKAMLIAAAIIAAAFIVNILKHGFTSF